MGCQFFLSGIGRYPLNAGSAERVGSTHSNAISIAHSIGNSSTSIITTQRSNPSLEFAAPSSAVSDGKKKAGLACTTC
ncbi:hypothetical protein PC113_g23634 [Phytophthora cactorum]|uniref:Uncharacterized protein n=1 Tax=Phytophthora cactorum TaxID=29920 RepID=A0A8T0XYR1_9STRA|nr:hypothetical protein PC113_g23634 [Phytophthora cactorum]